MNKWLPALGLSFLASCGTGNKPEQPPRSTATKVTDKVIDGAGDAAKTLGNRALKAAEDTANQRAVRENTARGVRAVGGILTSIGKGIEDAVKDTTHRTP